ncbi:MAG: 50S ribosomal protein L11 methyltransferase [Melioribacteraceae bacterium]|nr:50S ribosomal protein L11 methyltransferase [Melioribacteraceae bacterium]MCO6474372.1 50S ribosomal protein L11 methyltransferase [Melioribacteraceae bacterium]MDD3557260.1 50S ribosomal protein L11 methyltransferase [Melioribacteraceae bacterium]
MRKFVVASIQTEPQNNDIISGILWELNPAGITEDDLILQVYFPERLENVKPKLESLLNNLVKENVIVKFEINYSEIEDRNWNEEWESKTRIIEIDDKIIIKPTFRDFSPRKDQIVINIDPKMSFGTGEHQSTRLMLKLMQKYIADDFFVLDFGSGTGVLAIAAAKLSRVKKVIAIDNDEWCLLNGNENVNLNNIAGKVEVRLQEIEQLEENNFDLILANINKNVLISTSEKLGGKLKEKGTLLLSGILESDQKDIEEEFLKYELSVKDRIQEDEWIALALS